MENIFAILLRIFPFLVFLALEVVSFSLVVNTNPYHFSLFHNRVSSVMGNYYQNRSNISQYFDLRQQNDSLSKINARLLSENFLLQSQMSLASDSQHHNPWANQLSSNEQTRLIDAKVVYNSISKTRNYMIVDKGSADGVKVDMGVLGLSSPVGIVVSVSEHYSIVMSLLNKDANLSVKVKGGNEFGILVWEGPDIRLASLEDIPKHIHLKKDDEIETSGHSTIFPPNIPVGKVYKQIEDSKSNFAVIKVRYNTDFSQLAHVYIVEMKGKEELVSVTNEVEQLSQKDPKTHGQQ